MAVLSIAVTGDPFQKLTVRLDGTDYTLSLAYNQREDRWYLSIADDEEKPIVSGIKILANYPLLFRHRYNPALPAGEIIAVDTTTDGSPPGLSELGDGKRVQLTYFDEATRSDMKIASDPTAKPADRAAAQLRLDT